MDAFQREFDKYVEEALLKAESEDDVDAILESITNNHEEFLGRCHEALLKFVKADTSGLGLSEHRTNHEKFVERHYIRWKDGFDELETLVQVCFEVGACENERLRLEATANVDLKFDVLVRLHAKACAISSEIVCLLKNGYADGAHARWRALHEVAITALFLQKSGGDTVERFISHDVVDSYKGACQLRIYADRLQVGVLGDEEFRCLEQQYEEVIGKYGSDFKNPYGWAENFLGKKKANFADIENSVGMDHWRPYYKWASQNIHAGAKAINKSLSNPDTSQVLLVGSSNFGMTDPADAMAISLYQVTCVLLMQSPNIDSVVSLKVVKSLHEEIGPTFLRCREKNENQEFG